MIPVHVQDSQLMSRNVVLFTNYAPTSVNFLQENTIVLLLLLSFILSYFVQTYSLFSLSLFYIDI